jgi:hypothetical protein
MGQEFRDGFPDPPVGWTFCRLSTMIWPIKQQVRNLQIGQDSVTNLVESVLQKKFSMSGSALEDEIVPRVYTVGRVHERQGALWTELP